MTQVQEDDPTRGAQNVGKHFRHNRRVEKTRWNYGSAAGRQNPTRLEQKVSQLKEDDSTRVAQNECKYYSQIISEYYRQIISGLQQLLQY